MMKFKVGDRAEVTVRDFPYIVGEVGIVIKTEGDQEGGNIYLDIHPDNCILGTGLKAIPNTLADVQVGDVLVDEDNEHPILSRSGNIVVFGCKRDYGYAASSNYSIEELKAAGYSLKQPAPVEPVAVEMTVAEIAEKLGHAVKIVK